MRHKLTDHQRSDLIAAIGTIKGAIGIEYPDPPGSVIDGDEEPEDVFRWGIGDGFRMALDGVVEAALPGWRRTP